jgi:hypothetical protein
MRRHIIMFKISIIFLLMAENLFFGAGYMQEETVDRILALVNGQIITLTDLRIARAFGLYERGGNAKTEDPADMVLQKLIDQKLVIQVAGKQSSINREEMDNFLDSVSEEMGNAQFQEMLGQFGMRRNDLEPYMFERIVYNRIISSRFDHAVLVTLKEIQDYYEKKYVPNQQAQGQEVKSMLDILDEIEAALIKEKSEEQITEWLQNLREKADIQINLNS